MFHNLNSKTAYVLGMHVGDGTLYRTQRSIVWEVRGSLCEKDYYNLSVAPLLNSIFGTNLLPKFRSGGKNGCFGIQTTNKIITSFFLDAGFLPGKKTHTVRVPDYIKDSDYNIRRAFVAGLFDTDGCIRFEKKNRNLQYNYPKLEFSTVSKDLHDDLFSMLVELGFKCYKWKSTSDYKICLAGIHNLEKFMLEVAPKNKKHLNKYGFWKSHGYYRAGVA